MSITYDPEKWTNPLRIQEYKPVRRRKSAELMLVSLRELRYFNENEGSSRGSKAFAAFVKAADPEEIPPTDNSDESTG